MALYLVRTTCVHYTNPPSRCPIDLAGLGRWRYGMLPQAFATSKPNGIAVHAPTSLDRQSQDLTTGRGSNIAFSRLGDLRA